MKRQTILTVLVVLLVIGILTTVAGPAAATEIGPEFVATDVQVLGESNAAPGTDISVQ